MVKKVMKWILIVIAALIGLVIVGVTLLVAISNYKGANYWKFAEPKGMIETKYTGMGKHEVSLAEFDAPDTVWEKYEIWYPSNLKQSDQAYPVVVIANGTGMKASKQSAIYEHLASWGFIVAGNEDEHSRTGASSAATLDFILSLNEDPQSVFYGRIDTENIGIVGHSQGGVGAINAVTQQKNGNLYKTICAQSTTSSAVAYALNQLDGELGGGWNCDTSTLSIPAFMVAGTGSADAGNVEENRLELAEGEKQGICPLWWLRECFDVMPDTVPKVIGRLSGKDHGDIPFSADGYMTAWFMYWLQGDEAAGKAFFGADAEIGANENWQDVMSVFQKKVAALLVRIRKQSGGDCYNDGNLYVNFSEMAATLNGETISFTPLEYRLLKVLTKNPQIVLTRQVLLEKLWDIDGNFVDEHALTSAISRIRGKIERTDKSYIKTVYGMGYMWIGGGGK